MLGKRVVVIAPTCQSPGGPVAHVNRAVQHLCLSTDLSDVLSTPGNGFPVGGNGEPRADTLYVVDNAESALTKCERAALSRAWTVSSVLSGVCSVDTGERAICNVRFLSKQ